MNDLCLCLEVVSRSRQPLRYIWRWISLKPLEIEAWFQGPPIGNGIWAIKWSRDRWRHVTLKGQTRDPSMLRAQYLENGWRYRDSVTKDHQQEMIGLYGVSEFHVTDDVTWPQRCCEAVRSAILATAWLLVTVPYIRHSRWATSPSAKLLSPLFILTM